jgi:hypothetical protein
MVDETAKSHLGDMGDVVVVEPATPSCAAMRCRNVERLSWSSVGNSHDPTQLRVA